MNRITTLIAALALAGCGGGSGNDAADDVPLSGIEAKPPAEVAACLERAGYDIETAAGDSVAFGRGGGTGTIRYHADERAAIRAQADSNQQPDSVQGRKGQAVYTFAGEGFESASRDILGCL